MAPKQIAPVSSRTDVKRRFRQIDRSLETIANEVAAVAMAFEAVGNDNAAVLIAVMRLCEDLRRSFRELLSSL